MKRIIILINIFVVIAFLFSSCTEFLSKEDELEKETTDRQVEAVGSESDYYACIERHYFYSLEDFKVYCETGSKEKSLYKEYSKAYFPSYKMADGCFVPPPAAEMLKPLLKFTTLPVASISM